MSGGNPHRRTKEEKLDDMWKKVYGKRATRKKTRHVKPMAKGGRVTKLARTLSDTVAKDVRDSRKKLNVHQDPRSGLAASLRFHRDNPPKKKPIRSPHTDDPKKRTLRDKYFEHLKPRKPRDPKKRTLRDKYFEHLKPRKPRSKSNPRPFLGGLRPGVPLRRKK
jgi:hypothetical protein